MLRHGRLALALVSAAGLLTLAGCGDPEPDPAVAPIEVVVEGCTLNRDSVAAGTHQVSVVGSGSVSVAGPNASPMLVLMGGQPPASFKMAAGTWTVTCQTISGVKEVKLTVTE